MIPDEGYGALQKAKTNALNTLTVWGSLFAILGIVWVIAHW